jgi:small subunit ribosomal protein S17
MTENKKRPSRKATVISVSGTKSIVVAVEIRRKHFTGKVIKLTSKFHVHDENAQAKVGDYVLIEEGRKVSKTKSWHLVEVLSNRGDGK